MKLAYPACFYPDEEREGAYAVVVPNLPGCVSGGDTLAEAMVLGMDAYAKKYGMLQNGSR